MNISFHTIPMHDPYWTSANNPRNKKENAIFTQKDSVTITDDDDGRFRKNSTKTVLADDMIVIESKSRQLDLSADDSGTMPGMPDLFTLDRLLDLGIFSAWDD